MLVHMSSYLFMDFDVSLPPVIASWLTANVLTSLWVCLSWNPSSASSSTVHSNKLNHNVKTTRVCCLMRTCRVDLVYKARIKHEWIKKNSSKVSLSLTMWLQTEVVSCFFHISLPKWTGSCGRIEKDFYKSLQRPLSYQILQKSHLCCQRPQ